MYAALLHNKLVLAVNEAKLIAGQERKGQHYYCPRCQREVTLVVRDDKPYFKHVAKLINLTNEKKEHALSKKLLKTALTQACFDAQTEVSLASGQLRADVLASPILAFEIQCAPLNKSEFQHRHFLYRKIGVKDIWLVGRRHFLQDHIKKSQLIFFRKNKLWHDYYLEINPYKNLITLKYNVLLEPLTDKVHYQKMNFSLDAAGLKDLWYFHPVLKRYYVNPVNQKDYLQIQLAQKSIRGMRIGSKLYQNGQTINDLPEWVFSKFRRINTEDNATYYLY